MREISVRATKETDANTPVSMRIMLAAAAIHIPCMEKGICFARSCPANIAGCVVALDPAGIVELQYVLLRKILTAWRSMTEATTATLLEHSARPSSVVSKHTR